MKSWRFTLTLLTTAVLALPAPAGILFGKKPSKPNPAERVPELIVIVKTDKDESKRAAAAEELRQYDPAANSDIVPVLIDVLMNDAKPAVRVEAAESLGKLRPVSQEAGWALEQAKEKDSSWRVRTKAHYVLLTYQWAGYHPDPKLKDGPAITNPKDQPAEKGKVVVTPAPGSPKPPSVPPIRPATGETPAPPLADPNAKPAPPAPRPMPTGPAKLTPVPLPTVPVPPPPAPVKTEPAPLPVIPLPPADGGPGE
jgi:hypothetical protein